MRGEGPNIKALQIPSLMLRDTQRRNVVAHSGAVVARVGGKPVWAPHTGKTVIEHLTYQKGFYQLKGKYEKKEHREGDHGALDRAIKLLKDKQRKYETSRGPSKAQ